MKSAFTCSIITLLVLLSLATGSFFPLSLCQLYLQPLNCSGSRFFIHEALAFGNAGPIKCKLSHALHIHESLGILLCLRNRSWLRTVILHRHACATWWDCRTSQIPRSQSRNLGLEVQSWLLRVTAAKGRKASIFSHQVSAQQSSDYWPSAP